MQGGSVNMRSVQRVAISIRARKNESFCNAFSHVSKGCHGMTVQQGGVL